MNTDTRQDQPRSISEPVKKRPYEKPVVMKKRSVSRATLFSGSSSTVV